MKKTTDHNGNEYRSQRAMSKAYGHKRTTVEQRLRHGWDLEKALTTPLFRSNRDAVTDHLGKEYPTIKAMAEAYGISRVTLCARLRYGWDLERALTAPVEERKKHG